MNIYLNYKNSFEEANKSNQDIKKCIQNLRDEVKSLRGNIEIVDTIIYREFHPEILKLKINLKKFFEEQKLENFKLIKEIAILEKEKVDIQTNIYYLLGHLHCLEKEIGVTSKAFGYLFDQTIIDNEISNRIIIEREDL